MTLVRELIADAAWRPGRDYAGATPTVSVLLPTYRRGASGHFLRAARSVLAQTLREIELIVIDDASTDGTAAQIGQLMDEDGRVSCITHRRNVGLPAASIFEGYLRSRAPYLGFAFDDFVFTPHAFAQLTKAAGCSHADMFHGYARLVTPREDLLLGRRGTDFISYERLRQENVIPNSAVLLRREVVDSVGWFDPHVVLLRFCDHDYWRRISRRHVIEYVPVNTGNEFGPSLNDSLGNIHPIDFDEVLEFMRCERNHLLKPDAFLERSVVACPEGVSDRLHSAVARAAERSRARLHPTASSTAELPSPRIDNQRLVILGQPNASLSLVFDGVFRQRGPVQTVFTPCGWGPTDLRSFLGATAVIFDHRLFVYKHFDTLRRACETLNIPAYLITDDNFFVLQEEGRYPNLKAFEQSSTIDTIRRLAGLLVTSEALLEDARARGLNENVLMLSPVLNDDLRPIPEHSPPDRNTPLRAAVSGGPHRVGHFEDVIVPALNDTASYFPVRLIVRREAAGIRRAIDRRIEVELAEAFESFAEFVRSWRQYGPHVLIHPRGRTKNIGFKTDNAVLVAYLLGAVPIVADEPAYAALGETEGVLKVMTDTPEAWKDAFESIADADQWRSARAKLTKFCEARFDPRQNEEVLERLLDSHVACDVDIYRERVQGVANVAGLDTALGVSHGVGRILYRLWHRCPPSIQRALKPLLVRVTTFLLPRAVIPRF